MPITLTGSDPDGDTITFLTPSDPPHGTLTNFNPNTGAVTYTPDPNYNGPDSFTFKVKDSNNVESLAAATISITVNPLNDPPVADAQTGLSTDEDTALPITLTGSDPDGDTITFLTPSDPPHGYLTNFNPNTGAVTYTPDPNYNGPDSFTFKVKDSNNVESLAAATISITVNPLNDPPVADAQTGLSTDEDTALPITLTGSDPDGDTITFLTPSDPPHGI